MTLQRLSRWAAQMAVVGLLALPVAILPACATSQSVTRSPSASAAYQKTRVIKGLDILRDTAIAAGAQNPPLLSESTTRRIVLAHQGALQVMQASDLGWVAVVKAMLGSLLDNLPAAEAAVLKPYVTLAQTVIGEVGL